MVKLDKRKCIKPTGDLTFGEIYTCIGYDEDFITVAEVDNGVNSFYDWRFVKISNIVLSNNIKIL